MVSSFFSSRQSFAMMTFVVSVPGNRQTATGFSPDADRESRKASSALSENVKGDDTAETVLIKTTRLILFIQHGQCNPANAHQFICFVHNTDLPYLGFLPDVNGPRRTRDKTFAG